MQKNSYSHNYNDFTERINIQIGKEKENRENPLQCETQAIIFISPSLPVMTIFISPGSM